MPTDIDRNWIRPVIDVLTTNNFHKGELYNGITQDDGSTRHCYCTLGAIFKAYGADEQGLVEPQTPWLTPKGTVFTWKSPGYTEVLQDLGLTDEVRDLAEWLKNHDPDEFEEDNDAYYYSPVETVYTWNDSYVTTAEHILNRLREYAESDN